MTHRFEVAFEFKLNSNPRRKISSTMPAVESNPVAGIAIAVEYPAAIWALRVMWRKILAMLWPLHKQIPRSERSEIPVNIAVFLQKALRFDPAITMKVQTE